MYAIPFQVSFITWEMLNWVCVIKMLILNIIEIIFLQEKIWFPTWERIDFLLQ